MNNMTQMMNMNASLNFAQQQQSMARMSGMSGMYGMNGPMGPMGPGMMGGNPMMQMMQMFLQIMMSVVGGQMGQGMGTGMGGGCPMMSGNPGFGGLGMPMGGFGDSSMGGFLGSVPGGMSYGGSAVMPYNGSAGMPVGGPAFGGFVPPSSQGGMRAVDTARQFLGQRSIDIKGQMPHFRAAGGLTNNCADFVSSALRSADMLGGHEVSCKRMEQRLIREGWTPIPASQAGPGDVAFNPSRGHVVLCQGNGKMIGSNNVKPGLQHVTEKPLPQDWIVYRKG